MFCLRRRKQRKVIAYNGPTQTPNGAYYNNNQYNNQNMGQYPNNGNYGNDLPPQPTPGYTPPAYPDNAGGSYGGYGYNPQGGVDDGYSRPDGPPPAHVKNY
ncbi:hypothetical protein SBY92_002775 [Candida maltosa Xu316]